MSYNVKTIHPIKSGFTLVELLVSITIFVIFLGVVSNSYITIVRGEREANTVRRLYAETRSALTLMEEELRLSSIDYNCYGQSSSVGIGSSSGDTSTLDLADSLNPDNLFCPPQATIVNGFTNTLALINKSKGEKTFLFYDEQTQKLLIQKYQKNSAGWITLPGYAEPQPILGTDVAVSNLSFNIFPGVNPFSKLPEIYSNNAVQFQPQVRLFMHLESRNEDANQRIPGIDFQTTYSSRVYE